MLLIPLFDLIEDEGGYNKGQEMLLLREVLKTISPLIHSEESEK